MDKEIFKKIDKLMDKAICEIFRQAHGRLGLSPIMQKNLGVIQYIDTMAWGWHEDLEEEMKEIQKFKDLVLKIADDFPHIRPQILRDLYKTFGG